MSAVLFVCLHNAGRSQMSQALFEHAAQGRHAAGSAGTTPADRVHPEVVEVMRELGIDLEDRRPQLLTREVAERAQVIVTMGCGDQCPYVPGKRYVDWDLPDPKGVRSRTSAPSETRSPAASRSSWPSSTWSEPTPPYERLALARRDFAPDGDPESEKAADAAVKVPAPGTLPKLHKRSSTSGNVASPATQGLANPRAAGERRSAGLPSP
jgi:protein-tyrosine-phosphatase